MTGYEVIADEWKAFPGQDSPLILATQEEMAHKYSIPSAFEAYRREIRFPLVGKDCIQEQS